VRATRRLLWTTTLQAALTLGLAGSVVHVMTGHLGATHVVWGGGVILLLVAAWVFGVLNRRGIWQPYAHTTEAFLQLARERCRRRLAMASFLLWLAVANLAMSLGLAWWQTADGGARGLHWADRSAFATAAALVLGAVAWAIRTRRLVRNELDYLDALATHIANPEPPQP
jgi:hypothetical protein